VTALNIAVEFSRYPFGRYRSDGPYSGERFREEFLMPALQRDDQALKVILDGAVGMGSSFLEEAFGGLVRAGFDPNVLLGRIEIVSARDETLTKEIAGYIEEAGERRQLV
jgi:hypothetical protein